MAALKLAFRALKKKNDFICFTKTSRYFKVSKKMISLLANGQAVLS